METNYNFQRRINAFPIPIPTLMLLYESSSIKSTKQTNTISFTGFSIVRDLLSAKRTLFVAYMSLLICFNNFLLHQKTKSSHTMTEIILNPIYKVLYVKKEAYRIAPHLFADKPRMKHEN